MLFISAPAATSNKSESLCSVCRQRKTVVEIASAIVMSAEGECQWRSTSDSDNLTGLPELTQRTLLQAIQQRYRDDRIYTDVGDILVAVNPFCSLPIYSSGCSAAFSQPDQSGMAPHIFKTAARAYNAVVQAKKDQVCVISGESGAGKTESAKLIMKQVNCPLCMYSRHSRC